MNSKTDSSEPSGALLGSTALPDWVKQWSDGVEYDPCMSLTISEDSNSVELNCDNSVTTYFEWIKGEGADIGLIRCMETKRVVGIHLPLMDRKLCVHHNGPLRINAGFAKSDRP
jgi:hypothetical protein